RPRVEHALVVLEAQADPCGSGNRAAKVTHAGRSRSARFRAAALDLAAVSRRQQHEGHGVVCLRRLAGARVPTFGAIDLRDGIDAVALLELVLFHPRHVVLDGLWRLAHVYALR